MPVHNLLKIFIVGDEMFIVSAINILGRDTQIINGAPSVMYATKLMQDFDRCYPDLYVIESTERQILEGLDVKFVIIQKEGTIQDPVHTVRSLEELSNLIQQGLKF